MARFDIYGRKRGAGLLLQVQSGFLDRLDTRVVVPLLPLAAVPGPTRDLHPLVEVNGEAFVVATQLLAAVPRRELGAPVGNLAAERDAIAHALDLLLTGF